MPRPRNPNALTPAQRSAKSRARRAVRTVELPPEALEHARVIQSASGDASLTSAVVRALGETAARIRR